MKCSLGISNFLEISGLSLFFLCIGFLLFLCIDHWERLSYLSLLFFGTVLSNGYIFPSLQQALNLFCKMRRLRALLTMGSPWYLCLLFSVLSVKHLFIWSLWSLLFLPQSASPFLQFCLFHWKIFMLSLR